MRVEVDELRRLCEILISKAEMAGIDEVDIDADYYWLVSADDREDFSTGAPNICVGSIVDDMESLWKVLEGANPPTPVDFDRLANVLIAAGERISRSGNVY